MLNEDDIFFIKNLITTKICDAQNRLDRVKMTSNNADMEEEISIDIFYMFELIKRLEESWI